MWREKGEIAEEGEQPDAQRVGLGGRKWGKPQAEQSQGSRSGAAIATQRQRGYGAGSKQGCGGVECGGVGGPIGEHGMGGRRHRGRQPSSQLRGK